MEMILVEQVKRDSSYRNVLDAYITFAQGGKGIN